MRNFLFIYIFFQLWTGQTFCQTYDVPISNISSFLQDSKGYVWVSYEELYKLDGNDYKKYQHDPKDPNSIQEPYIQGDFHEDPLTNIWFCTPNYLYRYIRKKDHFENFQLSNEQQVRFSINLNNLSAYRIIGLDKTGYLWLQIDDENGGNVFTFNIYTKQWEDRQIQLSGIDFATTLNSEGELEEIYASFWEEGKGLGHLNIKTKEYKTLYKGLETRKKLPD